MGHMRFDPAKIAKLDDPGRFETLVPERIWVPPEELAASLAQAGFAETGVVPGLPWHGMAVGTKASRTG